MPVITRKASGRVVVVSQDTILNIVENRPVVAVVDAGATIGRVVERKTVVTATARGPQGPQGAPGLSGAGLLPPINFAFGDASPAVVLVVGDASEFTCVSLEIEQAFDGDGAQVMLGTAAAPGLLLDMWQSDPTTVGVYEVAPRAELAAGTQLLLTIIPGAGASAGRGQFVLTAVPTT